MWVPSDGLAALGDEELSFLCFPVDHPEHFDAVVGDADDPSVVREVQVKQIGATSRWVWGAFKVRGRTLRELHDLWKERTPRDPYLGTLVNAWLARGGRARAVREGRAYVDTGTVGGYREAMALLEAVSKLEGVLGRAAEPPRRVVRVASAGR